MERSNTYDKSAEWGNQILDQQWSVYESVLNATAAADIAFALGGAFALATYTGRLRNTKDLDIYVLPQSKEAMIQLLTGCRMDDYFHQLPYDRGWIYRGCADDVIVDVIWGMPNRRAVVDQDWLTRGPAVKLRGRSLGIVPLEELLWSKLYVVQRERCDWPDVWNLLFYAGDSVDWTHLLARVDEDKPLLGAVLSVFSWLCSDRAARFPSWVWDSVGAQPRSSGQSGSRSHLLDTRPWFGLDFNRSTGA